MPSKPRKISGSTSSSKRSILKVNEDDFKEFYQSTLKLINNLRDENDERNLVTPFIKLPSKKLYPDYYTVISNPITISDIQKSLAKGKYSYEDPDAFLSDFKLLHDNAVLYNDPESWIAKDSKTIYDFVKEQVEQFLAQTTPSAPKSPKVAKIKVKKPSKPDDDDAKTQEMSASKLTEMCKNVIRTVIDHKFPTIGVISGPFIEDIDRKEYPDYFKIVESPTSFNNVLKKLDSGLLSSKASNKENLKTFYDEMSLIFSNAQLYNDPSSLIYQDAVKLKEYFDEKFEQMKGELESTPSQGSTKIKLKLKNPLKKESPKVKINLKLHASNEEVPAEPVEQPKKRGRKKKNQEPINPVKEEKELSEPADESSTSYKVVDGHNEDDQKGLIEEDRRELSSEPSQQLNAMGKSSSRHSREESFIQETCLCSSQSSITQLAQVVRKNTQVPISNSQLLMHNIFPSHEVARSNTIFEYHFPATGYDTQSYTLVIPPDSAPLVTLKFSLHNALLDLRKKDVIGGGQTYSSLLTDDDFQHRLFLNSEEVPNSVDLSERTLSNATLLDIKFDLKLSYGLNAVKFECKVAPQISKKVRKTPVEPEVDSMAGRHTRHQLQQFKMNWDVETVNLIITYNGQ